jgi:predicted GTPase
MFKEKKNNIRINKPMVKKALKLVLIGETGIGKSKLGNFILQKNILLKLEILLNLKQNLS